MIASYWTGTPLTLEPHPQEESDSHSLLVLGHPGECVAFLPFPFPRPAACLVTFVNVELGSSTLRGFSSLLDKVGRRRWIGMGSGDPGPSSRRRFARALIEGGREVFEKRKYMVSG